MADVIDSNTEDNMTNQQSCYGSGKSMVGNCFTCSGDFTLDSAKFYLYYSGSPTGNCTAKLYSMSGTYGLNGVGDTLLATSDAVDVTTLPLGIGNIALVTFSFSGAQRIALSAGYYVIVFEYTGGSVGNSLYLGWDTSGVHSGNICYYQSGWASNAGDDCVFYVYGETAGSAGKNLTLLGVG